MDLQATPISQTALENDALLQVIARLQGEPDADLSSKNLAALTGRNPSNIARTLGRMRDDGLIFLDPTPDLTSDGREALEALNRARNTALTEGGWMEGSVSTGVHAEFVRNPDQPRKKFDAEKLEQLADTIEAVGILEPIVTFPKNDLGLRVIWAGERRWRAAGIVNQRHDDPNRVRIPYVTRAPTAEELADLVAEAAELALIENGQGEDLTSFEKAKALRAMIPARYPSARAAAKVIGVHEKTAQDWLKALAELPADVQARWEADELGWREVRDILRPAPAKTPEVDSEQIDIEEVTGRVVDEDPGHWKQGDDHDAWVRKRLRHALGSIKPRDLLAVVELADACHFKPYGSPHPGYTRTWSYETPVGKPQALISEYGCGGLSGGSLPELSHVHPATLEWLTDNGLFQPDGGGARSAMLYRVRQAVSQGAADQCEVTGRYHTAWLNPPRPTVDAGVKAAETDTTAARSSEPELSRGERVALIEATHKALTQNVATTGRAARIGAYWLDAACSTLKDQGLLTFVQAGGELGWCAMWGEKAYAWFKSNLPEVFAADGELSITDAQLALAQAEAATMEWSGPTWTGPGYVTPWLNADNPTTGEAILAAETAEREIDIVGDPSEVNEGLDEEALDTLVADLRHQLYITQTHTEGRWHHADVSIADLAARATKAVQSGKILDALEALMGMLAREGEDDANKALRLQSRATGVPTETNSLLKLERGHRVQKYLGGATTFELKDRQDSDGGVIGFRAQAYRNGKLYGQPTYLALTEISGFEK